MKAIIAIVAVGAIGAAAYYFNLIPGVGTNADCTPCESNCTESNNTQSPE